MRKKAELCPGSVSVDDVDVAAEDFLRFQSEMMDADRDRILALARESPSLRTTVVRALLTDGLGAFTSRGQRMSDRDLLAAVRVSFSMTLSGDPVWRQFYEHVNGLLLGMLTRPGWTQREVRQCKLVLSNLGSYYAREMTRMKAQLDQVCAVWKRHGGAQAKKRAGRRTLEGTHRVRTAVHFLERCGTRRPEKIVSEHLWNLTRKLLSPDSIRRDIFRRKAKLGDEQFRRESDYELSWWLAFIKDSIPNVASRSKPSAASRDT